jgi:alkyldihydroxyacetonephosphate synthase
MGRRWNGWGDETVVMALPEAARLLLERRMGSRTPPRDATLADALEAVPASRLPARDDLDRTTDSRLRYATAQSLPDWIEIRSGRVARHPDAVARPSSDEGIESLYQTARQLGARLVPYGGGTSVVGSIGRGGFADPTGGSQDDRPVITVDLGALAGLRSYDERSGLATFGAGTAGPEVEAALAPLGRTLGHFPQSFELSTVGGWIATRSSGQESMGYGRIEDLFGGGRVVAPAGRLDLPPFPASAAGPDLRQVVLGSEGRLGIVTEAVLRTSPAPDVHPVTAYAMPDWASGVACARDLAAIGRPLSMVRLSSPAEMRTTLAMAPARRSVALLGRYLRLRRFGPETCLLLVAAAGRRRAVSTAMAATLDVVRRHRGISLAATGIGRRWMAERFRAPYLRNALWEAGYAVDTVETAADWSRVEGLAASIVRALRDGLDDERVLPLAHLSHVYPTGSSIYVTYVFRLGPDPDATLERWRRLKRAASDAIVAGGGTISHQHGVGRDHRAWLGHEKGELGTAVLADLTRRFDPDGLLGGGVLVP